MILHGLQTTGCKKFILGMISNLTIQSDVEAERVFSALLRVLRTGKTRGGVRVGMEGFSSDNEHVFLRFLHLLVSTLKHQSSLPRFLAARGTGNGLPSELFSSVAESGQSLLEAESALVGPHLQRGAPGCTAGTLGTLGNSCAASPTDLKPKFWKVRSRL